MKGQPTNNWRNEREKGRVRTSHESLKGSVCTPGSHQKVIHDRGDTSGRRGGEQDLRTPRANLPT